MSRRRNLEEEARQTRTSYLLETGAKAAGLAAGAALFHRSGGTRALEQGATFARDFLTRGGAELMGARSSAAGRGMSALTNSARTGLRSAWDDASRAGADRIMQPRTTSIYTSMGSIMQQRQRLINESEKIIGEVYDNERILQPFMNRFGVQLTDPSANQKQLENFARQTLQKLKYNADIDTVAIQQLSKKQLDGTGLERQAEEMQLFLKDLAGRRKNELPGFTRERSGAIQDAVDKLMDVDSLRKRLGSAQDNDWMRTILGDRPATVDEVLQMVSDGTVDISRTPLGKAEETAEQVLRQMRERSADPEAFGQLFFDHAIRRRGDDFYSTRNVSNFFEAVQKQVNDTLPGKIFRVGSWFKGRTAPTLLHLKPGQDDAVLMARLTGQKDNLAIQEDMLRIHDRVYRFGRSGMEHIEELDGMKLANQGTRQRLTDQMVGNVRTRKERENFLLNKLDIAQSGQPTFWDNMKLRLTKGDEPHKWIRNAADRFFNYDDIKMRFDIEMNPDEYLDAMKSVDYFFSQHSRSLDVSSARLLRDNIDNAIGAQSSSARSVFDALTLSNEDLIRSLTSTAESSSLASHGRFINKDLISLINRYNKDPRAAMETISNKASSAGSLINIREPLDFFDLIRRETAKEGFLRHASDQGGDYNAITDLIDSALRNNADARNARLLSHWAAFQNAGQAYKNIVGEQTPEAFAESFRNAATLFIPPAGAEEGAHRFSESFRRDFKSLIKDNTWKFEKAGQLAQDMHEPNVHGEWTHIAKSITPLDLIKNINDAQQWKAFGKQFTAGRHNPADITELTMLPFFFMNRMSDTLNYTGLGFSTRSTGSNQQLFASIVGKRIIPAALGLTYMSYSNDLMQHVTGTPLLGHVANNFARMDLGARRIADATGLASIYQSEKEINPLLQYYGGGSEYMDYEERLEWYRDGYSPVRRSRWWHFGSLQELRGSDIAYFQPNYLRRAHSNWRSASLYDNPMERWKHSPVPTPTAPLSPLRYLWNPYWLEEKHMEDRPYPLSGKLFSEETPWGAVLNPTLGEIIKPQRRYHQNRLGSDMFDVRLLIEEQNMQERYKAANKRRDHLIRVQEGQFEPVRFTSMDAPTPSERVFSVGPGRPAGYGAGHGYGMGTGGAGGVSPIEYRGYGQYGDSPVPELQEVHGQTQLSMGTSLAVQAASGNIGASILSQMLPRGMATSGIEQANTEIFRKARINEFEGTVTPESIFRDPARYNQNILNNREALADLRNINKSGEAMTDIMYSARYLTGIYGYMSHVFTPTPKEYRLANANAMTSVSRSLWDESVGGAGGGQFEIVRRFLTVQNRYVEHVNPLMNTMPDWMPMHFRTGDPYDRIPKGGMRLPGDGYESLNRLHSDRFGEYGAYDRMKILADVAPFSDEYRQWRDIASRTVEDPYLREKMQEIRHRVAEQSSANDFYPYRFLGQGMNHSEAVIEQVLDNNHFTVVGSNEVFKMAGISVAQTEDGENVLDQFLMPGMSVRLGYDANEHYRHNEDARNSFNVTVSVDGQNLNRQLLDMELARRREDPSAAGTMGLHSDNQIARGKLYELITHANIPLIQDKYMRIRSPLEKYQREHIYGTPYASWRYPIDSYLKPAMEKAISDDTNVMIGTLTWMAANQARKYDIDKKYMTALNIATALTNRGAFVGGLIGFGAKLGGSSWVRHGSNIGAVATLAGYAYTRQDELPTMAIAGAGLGAAAMKLLEQPQLMGKAAGVGALASIAYVGARNSFFTEEGRDNIFGRAPYIPQRVEDRWEMQEYFDRLKYIKYSGLYEKAARRARLFEGTNIKKIMREYDISKKENEELKRELLMKRETLGNIYAEGDERAEAMMAEIDRTIENIDASQQMYLRGGKYTRSALIYKQAMESTIFGMREDATWSQILRALPRNDRDFFIEFSKERDPERRKEILQYVSPYMARALKIAWGEDPGRLESNRSFFQSRHLPGPMWSGWRPEVDMDDVAIKAIHNEGMMISDFGYFDSQLRDPDVIDAPYLEPSGGDGILSLQAKLSTSLRGMGLFGANVEVTPSNRSGIQVMADVVRVGQYQLSERVNSAFGRLI